MVTSTTSTVAAGTLMIGTAFPQPREVAVLSFHATT